MQINPIFDFVLLLGGLAGLVLGLRRGFLRTILATIALLLAMAFAALAATPLVGMFVQQSGSQAETPIGLVFAALLLVIYVLLETLLRHSFPHTRIRALGSIDNVLGAVISPGWTLLAVALAVLIVGYINFAVTGAPNVGPIGGWYTSSNLVSLLRAFFDLPLNLMRFLFPAGLPQPLAFFAAG